MSGTQVLKSKEPRARRVVEALVVGTLGGVKLLHSSTPTCSPGRSAIGENLVLALGTAGYRLGPLRKGTPGTFLIGQSAPFLIHPSPN